MILNASVLTDHQLCRRRGLLGRDWILARWRPKALADHCLRRGIQELAKGTRPPEAIVREARLRFLEIAADPGLDVIGDPYYLAKDWCTLIETILTYLADTALPVLHERVPVMIGNDLGWHEWRFNSWCDDSGELHRWVTVDRWDLDAQAREMHSWRTVGDMAVARVPMVLHIIEIGQQRGGRHQQSWTRAYRHPGLPHLSIRFGKPDETNWLPFYQAEQREYTVKEWIGRAARERALERLVRVEQLKDLGDAAGADIRGQIMAEVESMTDVSKRDWRTVPMSRPACDAFYPCPFQNVCYGDGLVPIEKMGLYVRREHTKVSPTEVPVPWPMPTSP